MIKKRTTGYLLQDVGLVLFLICVGAIAITVGNAEEGRLLEYVCMMMATFLAVLFTGFKLNSLGVVTAGFSILAYTAYKLYNFYSYSEEIAPLSYVWIVIPIFAVGSMLLFIYGSRQTEMENDVLKEQVEELVMVNSLTGLYNLRSLYNDLRKQSAYAERNHMTISLMIIKLRYEQELRNVLSRQRYEMLLQRMAMIVVDAVRVEDRTYSLDNYGTIGVILTCDEEGSDYAKKRIKAKIEDKEAFKGITDSSIMVEVKIASLQYDKELYGNDMITFKQKVENELQYDV